MNKVQLLGMVKALTGNRGQDSLTNKTDCNGRYYYLWYWTYAMRS